MLFETVSRHEWINKHRLENSVKAAIMTDHFQALSVLFVFESVCYSLRVPHYSCIINKVK